MLLWLFAYQIVTGANERRRPGVMAPPFINSWTYQKIWWFARIGLWTKCKRMIFMAAASARNIIYCCISKVVMVIFLSLCVPNECLLVCMWGLLTYSHLLFSTWSQHRWAWLQMSLDSMRWTFVSLILCSIYTWKLLGTTSTGKLGLGSKKRL